MSVIVCFRMFVHVLCHLLSNLKQKYFTQGIGRPIRPRVDPGAVRRVAGLVAGPDVLAHGGHRVPEAERADSQGSHFTKY